MCLVLEAMRIHQIINSLLHKNLSPRIKLKSANPTFD